MKVFAREIGGSYKAYHDRIRDIDRYVERVYIR
ncbi:phage integrase N-terminal domain-containing protein [Xenorhabdus siamensis]